MRKRLLCILIIAVMLASCACVEEGDTSIYAGKWVCVSVEFMGVACDPDVMYDGKAPAMTITNNGRATFTVNDMTLKGDWVDNGTGITISSNSTALSFAYTEDSQLVCEMSSAAGLDSPVTLYFEKSA